MDNFVPRQSWPRPEKVNLIGLGREMVADQSILVGTDNFSHVASSERPPGLRADCVFDESDRAIAERDVDSAWVIARRCDRIGTANYYQR